jgi:putative YhdH/YhfP family quinone oxidoreductase
MMAHGRKTILGRSPHMLPETFRCYLVTQDAAGRVAAEITRRSIAELPAGDVLLRVVYSSLNYKDALAATGNLGVNKVFPHVPGVDAAGIVVASAVPEFRAGDQVIVTGFDMGANRWGGYAEYVRVPWEWIVPLPAGLTLRESMMLGTAGFTAGLCVDALQKHEVSPDRGEVIVTGASGGVGSMAVSILAALNYQVVAVTGKTSAHEYLRSLGATRILAREQVDDQSGRPLLSARWAGGVDTVGGNILSTILRSTRHSGCVTACGLAASNALPITVFPFILRAVTLSGIDAAWGSLPLRHEVWRRLAAQWKPPQLEAMAQFTDLTELPKHIDDILAGRVIGRVVVKIAAE